MLLEIDEQEEVFEHAEEIKWLCEYIDELNNQKELHSESKEIEDVIRNYINEWAVWGIAMSRKDVVPRLRMLYGAFCFQISNMILGIYKLTKDGLDYQAMCLIRVLLEMIFTFLAILIDSDYREKYLETADTSKEYQLWRSELRIKKAEEIVWNYAESVKGEVRILCCECKKIYEEMYKELSRYEHNSYTNMMVMQYALVDEGRLTLNINGNKVTGIERTLKQVLLVIVPMEALFSRVVFENEIIDHNLPEDEFGQKVWSFAMVLHIIVSDLAKKYLDDLEVNESV